MPYELAVREASTHFNTNQSIAALAAKTDECCAQADLSAIITIHLRERLTIAVASEQAMT